MSASEDAREYHGAAGRSSNTARNFTKRLQEGRDGYNVERPWSVAACVEKFAALEYCFHRSEFAKWDLDGRGLWAAQGEPNREGTTMVVRKTRENLTMPHDSFDGSRRLSRYCRRMARDTTGMRCHIRTDRGRSVRMPEHKMPFRLALDSIAGSGMFRAWGRRGSPGYFRGPFATESTTGVPIGVPQDGLGVEDPSTTGQA